MLDALRGLHAGLSQALALVERLVATGLLSMAPRCRLGARWSASSRPRALPPRPERRGPVLRAPVRIARHQWRARRSPVSAGKTKLGGVLLGRLSSSR